MMERIVIIGLGLIGASLGLAVKRAVGGSMEVVGCSRGRENAARALGMGAVDRLGEDISSAVGKADVVIVATPVMADRKSVV